jgi:hypothetical protein
MKLFVAWALATTGCDPLADNTYVGEPLITLEGSFSETIRTIHVDGKLALLWQDADTAGGPGAHVIVVPFALGSLGTFTAPVPVPPPPGAMFGFDDAGPELAEAYVHLVTHVPITTSEFDLGLDPVHVLVFAQRDIVDGDAAGYLGGAVTAGYHLRRFTPTNTPGPAQRQLIERCVANTGNRAACETRRGYQLDADNDGAALRIVLRVQ